MRKINKFRQNYLLNKKTKHHWVDLIVEFVFFGQIRGKYYTCRKRRIWQATSSNGKYVPIKRNSTKSKFILLSSDKRFHSRCARCILVSPGLDLFGFLLSFIPKQVAHTKLNLIAISLTIVPFFSFSFEFLALFDKHLTR